MTASKHKSPALHNAMWPGIVGKGSPGAEPFIDLDTMLDFTAAAEVNGVTFEAVGARFALPAAFAVSTVFSRRRRTAGSIAATSVGEPAQCCPVQVKNWPPQNTSTPIELSLNVFVSPATMMCTPFPLGLSSV